MVDKITVATTGDFMLLDPENGQEIEPGKKVKVEQTAFIDQKIAQGQLRSSAHVAGLSTPDEGPSREAAGGETLTSKQADPPRAEGARASKAK